MSQHTRIEAVSDHPTMVELWRNCQQIDSNVDDALRTTDYPILRVFEWLCAYVTSPWYMSKSFKKPRIPLLSHSLNPHLLGLFERYCLNYDLPLNATMISSMEWNSSGETTKKFSGSFSDHGLFFQ